MATEPEQDKQQTEKAPSKQAGGSPRTLRMGTESIPKLLVEFAIPSIAGMLVNGAYNVISAVFLGQAIGALGLAVTTAAFPITIIFMALAMLIGNGGNSLCALRLGQGELDEAERVLGNTFTLSIIVAIFVALLAVVPFTMEALLSISSTTAEIHDMTYHYVFILSLGFMFQMVGMGINNFIRSCGAPNRALLTMVIGAVSCIILSWLFVMLFGWGVEGSALATVLGQAISCVSVMWYFLFTKDAPLRLRTARMRLVRPVVHEILLLGTASFILQVASALLNFFMNYQLVKYGALSPIGSENALAAIGVVQRLTGFFFLPIIGVSAAAQPLLGYNYGAGYLQRVRSALGFAILGGSIIGTIMWLIAHLFPVPIVSLFGVSDQLMDVTVFALQVQLMMFPIISFQIIGSNYFQATGQPMKSILLSLTRQVLFFIPLMFILPEVLPLVVSSLTGLDGLFFTFPFADLLAVFTAGGFLLFELKRLRRLEAGEITDRMVSGHRS